MIQLIFPLGACDGCALLSCADSSMSSLKENETRQKNKNDDKKKRRRKEIAHSRCLLKNKTRSLLPPTRQRVVPGCGEREETGRCEHFSDSALRPCAPLVAPNAKNASCSRKRRRWRNRIGPRHGVRARFSRTTLAEVGGRSGG